jgi:hypothetical protein
MLGLSFESLESRIVSATMLCFHTQPSYSKFKETAMSKLRDCFTRNQVGNTNFIQCM